MEYNPFADAGKEEEMHWHMSGGTGSMGGYAVSAKGEYAEFCKKLVMDWVEQRAIVSAQIGTITALKEAVEPNEPRPASYQDFADHVGDIKSTTKFEWALSNQELIVALEDTSELLNTGSSWKLKTERDALKRPFFSNGKAEREGKGEDGWAFYLKRKKDQ